MPVEKVSINSSMSLRVSGVTVSRRWALALERKDFFSGSGVIFSSIISEPEVEEGSVGSWTGI